MYKVLIVDDESWVVESLKVSVNWNELGFAVCGEAYGGLEALRYIQQERPDVVFTDIRMPGMTGIELIKKGGELPEPPKFVVVSGYAEFAYAQRALNYGAAAYCLKPYDEQEIMDVLKKLKKSLDSARQLSDSTMLQLLAEHNEESLFVLKQEFEKRGIHIDGEHGAVAVVCAATEGPFPEIEYTLGLKIGRAKMLYLMDESRVNEAVARLEREFAERIKGIGVSFKMTDYRMLKNGMDSAGLLANQFFITGSPGVFKFDAMEQGTMNDLVKKIGAAIGGKDLAALGKHLDEAAHLFTNDNLTARHALHLYNVAVSFLYSEGGDERDGMLFSYEQLMEMFPNVSEMIHYLRTLSMRVIRKNPEQAPIESSNETFKSILQYVHEHYRHDISIQSLTQKYYISPNYVSQLFKKEVGETFTSYMTKLRISFACEQLEQTNLMVSEIAEKAGYNDYFYFTRMFKKVTGKTPTQYREHKSK